MENSKVFSIFAGINGAGKSTLYHSLGAQNFGVRINSDEWLRENGLDWHTVANQAEAARAVLQLQQQCLKEGRSLNRETTLVGFGILKTILEAKELGYQINLYFVGVDSLELAKKRIKKRVALGGHDVVEASVDSRYEAIPKAMYNVLPHCDNVKFYDNTNNNLELVAYKVDGEFAVLKEDCKWLKKLFSEIENVRDLDEKFHNQTYPQMM